MFGVSSLVHDYCDISLQSSPGAAKDPTEYENVSEDKENETNMDAELLPGKFTFQTV